MLKSFSLFRRSTLRRSLKNRFSAKCRTQKLHSKIAPPKNPPRFPPKKMKENKISFCFFVSTIAAEVTYLPKGKAIKNRLEKISILFSSLFERPKRWKQRTNLPQFVALGTEIHSATNFWLLRGSGRKIEGNFLFIAKTAPSSKSPTES